jgi:GDSL-like lipase/acylhydrolase family protein
VTGMSRRRGLDIALLVASVLVSLILSEAVLRVLGRGPLRVNPVPGAFWRHDALLGWRNSPGADGVFDHPRFRINVHTNSNGLRDREYAYEKTPGTRRILVIGDSFVWGYGVEQPETFPKVLEARLPHVDVINAGVAGYGTDQELLWLRSEGVRYRPDLVILVMCGNDDDENNHDLVYDVYRKPRFRQDGRGELVLTGVPVPLPSRALRLKHWILTNAATAFQVKSAIIDPLRYRQKAAPAEEFGLTLALVDGIADVVRGIDARLVVVMTARYAPSTEFHYDALVEGVRRRGIPTLDIDRSPGYRTDTMLIAGDAHWNRAGHRYVAEQLRTMIQDHHLLD